MRSDGSKSAEFMRCNLKMEQNKFMENTHCVYIAQIMKRYEAPLYEKAMDELLIAPVIRRDVQISALESNRHELQITQESKAKFKNNNVVSQMLCKFDSFMNDIEAVQFIIRRSQDHIYHVNVRVLISLSVAGFAPPQSHLILIFYLKCGVKQVSSDYRRVNT
ncbi:hypothetical protein T10_7869 [Trichinella papuae]|uniref:Uncharacterized protein n=1 Tax=Trichinella papuae TaxID=268474 RepID=A0A0V1MH63_9BILA|nr:hypothetical protein T10_7869 [Trichinella papuae]